MFNIYNYTTFSFILLSSLPLGYSNSLPNSLNLSLREKNHSHVLIFSNEPNIRFTQGVTEEERIKTALSADAKDQNLQPPQIGLITIAGDYAIATTYDEVSGGESVLKKERGRWQVIGGTGGAFSKPEELVEYGKVPRAIASRLLQIRAKQQQSKQQQSTQ